MITDSHTRYRTIPMMEGLDLLRFMHGQAEQREDGIVVLTFDRAGESVNTFAQDVLIEREALLERLPLDPPKGLVPRSGKAKRLIARADLREFAEFDAQGAIGDPSRRGPREFPCLSAIDRHGDCSGQRGAK